jgi:hypothetical protein
LEESRSSRMTHIPCWKRVVKPMDRPLAQADSKSHHGTVCWQATVRLQAGNCSIGSLGRQDQVVTTECPPGASVRKNGKDDPAEAPKKTIFFQLQG